MTGQSYYTVTYRRDTARDPLRAGWIVTVGGGPDDMEPASVRVTRPENIESAARALIANAVAVRTFEMPGGGTR